MLASKKSFALLVFSFAALGAVTAFSFYAVLDSFCENSYRFINSNIVCDDSPVLEKTTYRALEDDLTSFVDTEKDAGRLRDAGIYFRDLHNGPVFGINETLKYTPASLLKLPLAFVYLTRAERDPEILLEQLSVADPKWEFSTRFPPREIIDPTEPHSIEDLIMQMLAHSDNNAYGVLQTHLYDIGEQSSITQTFLELGFLDPSSITDDVMNVRQYASLFRLLYNASYLNASLSEKVLEWLADSEFDGGLVAGVPSDVQVAHKFGERFLDDGEKQLHDCGIVYYPGNPYLLCVMTRGTDFDTLSSVIRNVSEKVYREVDSRRIR